MSNRLKGQISRLVKRMNEVLVASQKLLSTDVVLDQTLNSCEEIKTHVCLLKDLEQRYESLMDKMEEADENNEGTLEDGEETMELTLRMSEMSIKLSSRLETIDFKLEVEPNPRSSDAVEKQLAKLVELETARSNRQSSNEGAVNLPKLEFPTFHGEILKWNEFWDSFSAAVDKNQSLQPVQKLTYLLSKLRGEAKSVVAGFQITNENYSIVVQMLRQRFGDQQAAITAHYSRIMEITASPNHTERLRSLHDELEKHLRCVSALGEDTDHRHFISLIMTKLPKAVIIKLEEMKGPDEAWTVQILQTKLQNHLVARESAERQGSATFHQDTRNDRQVPASYSPEPRKYGHREDRFQPTAASYQRGKYATAEMLYASDKEKRAKSPLCIFCKQKHWSDECNEFTTVVSRKRCIKGRCFNCLGKDHSFRNCTSNKPCFHCKKIKDHHSSLCPKKFSSEKEPSYVAVDESENESVDESLLASGERALLQTALVKAISLKSSNPLNLRLLFDSGSHRSYISQEAVRNLGLKPTGSETIAINTFGARKSKNVETQIVEFSLKLQDGTTTTIVSNVVPIISASIQRRPINLMKYRSVLKDIRLADALPKKTENAAIDILIGSDYYMDLITFEKKKLGDGIHLLGSKFGWILTGRVPKHSSSDSNHSMLILNTTNQSVSALCHFQAPDKSCPIDPNTEDFWKLETIGIKDSQSEINDEQALDNFNKHVKYENGRYLVKWPWREENRTLPTNYQMSLGRLNSLIRRLGQNPEMLQQYNNIIKDQQSKDMIEKVGDNQTAALVHYIPHQAVLTPQKNTTKVRIVYDALAKTRKDSSSLNENLLRGPVILEDLCGLLMRFRLHKYAIVADIEKAFLQVGLQDEDRDVVRFLWLKDSSKHTTLNNLQIYRFCRVPFGVISSPFLLGATVAHHLKKANTSIADQISNNMYVDNLITGVSTLKEAEEMYKEGKWLFRQASMNLREWISNSEAFAEKILEADRCKELSPKVLGMIWKLEDDSLAFGHVSCNMNSSSITKREVFKKIAKTFDPLGFISPVTICGKMFLQQLWQGGMKWDDHLDCDQQMKWKNILLYLGNITEIKIPRHLQCAQDWKKAEFSLICFCDASAKAYACCVYLRYLDQCANVKVSLIFAKSRLAPIKRQTIPRLELLAVLVGVRSMKFVQQHLNLPIHQKVLWSDSQCVLHWIGSTKLQATFSRNRLSEINSHKDVSFRYVPSEDNPADFPTRGMSAVELKDSQIWWSGPPWLRKSSVNWPNIEIIKDDKCCIDDCKPKVLFEASLIAKEEDPICQSPFGIDSSKFSTLNRLLRVTAYCQRFVDRMRKLKHNISRHLSPSDLAFARLKWETNMQHNSFPDVVDAVSKGKKHDLVSKFDLFVDVDNLIRCRGRLQLSQLSRDSKFPKLLAKNDQLTSLLIEDIHRSLHHAGASQTLAQMRQQYWLPHGRSQVQKVLSRCTVCRRWQGGAYKMPAMPSFPTSRVVKATPFTYTGVDYFGPLYVKGRDGNSKVWVCLFTCLTVRAIHLEVVVDMSAEDFLLCFRRFVSRRGCPVQMFSDNGSNFQAASSIITAWKSISHSDDVQSYLAIKQIDWKFIPQHAPWMGGFYERLIGVVKRSLRKAIGRLSLTILQLQTVLSEVEAVVNSRPLTGDVGHVNVGDELSSECVLTPSCFLSLNPSLSLAPSSATKEDEKDPDFIRQSNSREVLLQIWKKGQIHLNEFWRDWHHQYLTSLRERIQKLLKQAHHLAQKFPEVNDVVLVKDNVLPRGSWKVARITELISSSDGQLRSAKIMFPSGKQTVRPLALLYPMECSSRQRHEHSHSSSLDVVCPSTQLTPRSSCLDTVRLSKPECGSALTPTPDPFSSYPDSPASGVLSETVYDEFLMTVNDESAYSACMVVTTSMLLPKIFFGPPYTLPVSVPLSPPPIVRQPLSLHPDAIHSRPDVRCDYARSSAAAVTPSVSVGTSTPDSSFTPPLPSGASKTLNDYECRDITSNQAKRASSALQLPNPTSCVQFNK